MKPDLEAKLKKLGLEVDFSHFCDVYRAVYGGHILVYWDSEEELLRWAYDVSGDERFLDLIG